MDPPWINGPPEPTDAELRAAGMISENNRFTYRFSIARNGGRWEITDHVENEVEELLLDSEIWLADRLEVIEVTAAANHREVMRLQKVLRDHGLLDETLHQPKAT